MQRRLPLLFVLAAVTVGLLWGLLWPSGAPTGELADQADLGGHNGAGPGSELAMLAPAAAGRVEGRTTQSTWTVLVSDVEGRSVPTATIAATMSGADLDAVGSADWRDVTPGTWHLVVSNDDGHRSERQVEILPGASVRTHIRLGAPVVVVGHVQNTRGESLGEHLVLFLQPGERPPRVATELTTIPSGVTTKDGMFEARLPAAGAWRPFVVYGGKVLHEATSHELLDETRTHRCDVVVPAATRLVIDVDQSLEAGPASRAMALSVYRRSTPLEIAHDVERRQRAADIVAAGEPVDDVDTSIEIARARAAEDDPVRLAQVEKQKLWRTVVPEGWRNVGSSAMPPSGRLVFNGLPHDTEFRLALRRGDEVFRVSESIVIPFASELSVRLDPPAPPPDGAPTPDELGECPAAISAIENGGQARSTGVVWR